MTLAGLRRGAPVIVVTSTTYQQLKPARARVDAAGRLTVAVPTRSVVTVAGKG